MISKRVATVIALLLVLPMLTAATANAEEDDGIQVVDIRPIVTPTPSPVPVPTPAPTPKPDPAKLPCYAYDEADLRCLSRAIWSITPKNPTWETKLALCEVVLNRVEDESGVFENSVRYVLLQKGEFRDYDPEAHRSERNDEIADYALRAWIHAKNGDRSYKLVPPSGVKCSFYSVGNTDYIEVYDMNGNVVYDSGAR